MSGVIRARSPRVAVRAVILHENRLLLVNAWPGGKSDLMCAPGGGVAPGSALPDNLTREVFEETGLHISVGVPCLINEFHDPASGFHQVEVFFRCTVSGDAILDPAWCDPEQVVSHRRWVTQAEMVELRVKPTALSAVAFDPDKALIYDPLEPILP